MTFKNKLSSQLHWAARSWTVCCRWAGARWLWLIGSLLLVILLFSLYCLAASPYSNDSFVESPFTTQYVNNQVILSKHFTPYIYRGWFFSTIGYLEQLVTDVWARLQSPKEPAGSVDSIAAAIYAQRFDPNKPYLISGDQFDGLYLRNLSVFYQDLLDRHTAITVTDWHNRQRIALQSLAYALVATQQLHYPVTTLLPISPRSVIALNFWNYPSDSMFSLFQLLQTLEADPATKQAVLKLQYDYGGGLTAAYQNYLTTVRDPETGLVRRNMHLSSARDAVQRQSSFYDNVILWKTEQLATALGFAHVSNTQLTALRNSILQRYWDRAQDHFVDDMAAGDQHSYSSDWLIVLPTGFLNPNDPTDLIKLVELSRYIDEQHLTQPLPIRYTAATNAPEDFFVHFFVGSYGNTAIWSYWGDEYIGLEEQLYQQTRQPIYAQHIQTALAAWGHVIVRDRGYPETLNAQGKMLETLFYESIRRNGWIVDYEAVKYDWDHLSTPG
ncbi:MAG TPA: hypothetical protein VGS08_00140 [Candidatus Saccharimonadales bacterium]|nr:hypothetical protein [Candidatus Saccharimonadales bacterium]